MPNQGTEGPERLAEKLVRRKRWTVAPFILVGVGGALFVVALGWGVIASMSGPLPLLLAAAMGFGLVLVVIGLASVGIAEIAYNAHKRSTLSSIDRQEAVVDSLIAMAANVVDRRREQSIPPLHVQHKNIEEHATIIAILGDIGNKRATLSIVPALEDAAPLVRCAAARTLGRLGDERAVAPLITALEDGAKEVRKEAARALDGLGWTPQEDTEKANYLLAGERWDELAILGKPGTAPLIRALKDADKKVRQRAAETLGGIGDERAVAPLITALEDGAKEVRKEAARALDGLGWTPQEDTEKANYLLAGERWDELAILGKPATDRVIGVLLKDGDKKVRQRAAETLGEIADERAVAPLSQALNDREETVREAAKAALSRIRKQQASQLRGDAKSQ